MKGAGNVDAEAPLVGGSEQVRQQVRCGAAVDECVVALVMSDAKVLAAER